MNYFKKIIEEICIEDKLNYQYISNDYILVLEKNNKYRYLYNNLIGLNSEVSGKSVDDKYAMYEILKYHDISVIEYELIWNPGCHKNIKEINSKVNYLKNYFKEHNNQIVLKPNNGYAGINVFKIDNIDEIKDKLNILLDYTNSIVANPYYEIKNEHRVIILNNKVRLIYTKNLSKNNWQFNLSKGNYVTKVTNPKLKKDIINLALKTYKVLNLIFVSIDIVEDYQGNLSILEVNSSVSMSKYLEQIPNDYILVKEIYHDAIRELFNE